MNINTRPTIGLALSGSGSRFIFYIGFLEELAKAGIQIDYISAMSGASVVAAAFACGRLEFLKDIIFNLDKKQVLNMLPKGKGGMYSLDKLEELGRQVTNGARFEDVKPLMGFVAADIANGQQITISMGDLARAARISCTLPAVFEAVQWGGKTLIDGGLLNIIPVDVVKQAGLDIVIGVNMRGTNHLFTSKQMAARKIYNLFKKLLLFEYMEKVWDALIPEDEEELDMEIPPNMFKVLSKSLDLAIAATKLDKNVDLTCDLMVTPDLKKFRLKNIETTRYELYEFGKKIALENIPRIKKLIEEKQKVAV
jgi:predicted acylesterase/phospholipase RssA